MIFAAMVERDNLSSDGEVVKITVSIIDLATQWKINDVHNLFVPNEEEVQYEIERSTDFCAREYGYFLATI